MRDFLFISRYSRVFFLSLIALASLLLFVEFAYAQSATADLMASCSASFHLTCVDDAVTVDISGSGVPMKDIGDSAMEILFLSAIGLAGAARAICLRLG